MPKALLDFPGYKSSSVQMQTPNRRIFMSLKKNRPQMPLSSGSLVQLFLCSLTKREDAISVIFPFQSLFNFIGPYSVS